MTGSRGAKSILASVVGWLVVGLLLFWLLGAVIGTIRFIIRFLVWIVLLGALATLYFKLKEPPD